MDFLPARRKKVPQMPVLCAITSGSIEDIAVKFAYSRGFDNGGSNGVAAISIT